MEFERPAKTTDRKFPMWGWIAIAVIIAVLAFITLMATAEALMVVG